MNVGNKVILWPVESKKGTRMNCWEVLYMQAFHQCNILIKEQQVNDINPLYELAYTSRGQLHIP